MTLSIDGRALPSVQITKGNTFFNFNFPLAAELTGKDTVDVAISLDHTIRLPWKQAAGELGVAFGVFEVRN